MTAKHIPTPESEAFVLGGVISGMNQTMIANTLGISEPTLRAHYAEKLAWGAEVALARVAQTAYGMAISGEHPAMTMFYLKTRGGWRETASLDVNVNIRDKVVEMARELGLTDEDAAETIAEIESRIKDKSI